MAAIRVQKVKGGDIPLFSAIGELHHRKRTRKNILFPYCPTYVSPIKKGLWERARPVFWRMTHQKRWMKEKDLNVYALLSPSLDCAFIEDRNFVEKKVEERKVERRHILQKEMQELSQQSVEENISEGGTNKGIELVPWIQKNRLLRRLNLHETLHLLPFRGMGGYVERYKEGDIGSDNQELPDASSSVKDDLSVSFVTKDIFSAQIKENTKKNKENVFIYPYGEKGVKKTKKVIEDGEEEDEKRPWKAIRQDADQMIGSLLYCPEEDSENFLFLGNHLSLNEPSFSSSSCSSSIMLSDVTSRLNPLLGRSLFAQLKREMSSPFGEENAATSEEKGASSSTSEKDEASSFPSSSIAIQHSSAPSALMSDISLAGTEGRLSVKQLPTSVLEEISRACSKLKNPFMPSTSSAIQSRYLRSLFSSLHLQQNATRRRGFYHSSSILHQLANGSNVSDKGSSCSKNTEKALEMKANLTPVSTLYRPRSIRYRLNPFRAAVLGDVGFITEHKKDTDQHQKKGADNFALMKTNVAAPSNASSTKWRWIAPSFQQGSIYRPPFPFKC